MADAPSELTAEIGKLEQKHAETPGGRYFVPLANAYRKVGDFARAEALLHEGLRRHPDYLSAHIVLGRCYTDRGAHDSAAEEFRHVLSLDPQNLIALSTLGELARERGETDEAAHWFSELLAVDPMNDEARAALDEITAPEADDTGVAETLAADAGTGEVDEADAAPALDVAGGAADEVELGGWEPSDEVDAFYLEPVDLGTAAPEEAPVEAELQPELDALDVEPALVDDAWPWAAAEAEDESGAEPAATEADGELADAFLFPGEAALELPAFEEEVRSEEEVAAPEVEDDFGSDTGEVVTRTIAELYARQGLYDRAASVYRELIRREGDSDAGLEERLADVERRAREAADFDDGPLVAVEAETPAETIVAFAPEQNEEAEPDAFAASFEHGFAGAPAEIAEIDAVPASDTEPLYADAEPDAAAAPRIAAYLAELVAWTPSAAGAAPEPAEPPVEMAAEPWATTPADAVPAAADEPEPFPWELPPPEPVEPAAPTEKAFSFDGFFGDEPAAPLAPPAPAAPPAETGAGPGDDEAEDLESFQAWLRSLKR